jgi:hypothetical protein
MINAETQVAKFEKEKLEVKLKDATALVAQQQSQLQELTTENTKLETLVTQQQESFKQLQFAQAATEAVMSEVRKKAESLATSTKQSYEDGQLMKEIFDKQVRFALPAAENASLMDCFALLLYAKFESDGLRALFSHRRRT